jgi:RecB family exonuclease
MWAAVEEKWNEINFDAPWMRSQWLNITRSMVDALADYVRAVARDGGQVLASEKYATVTLSTPEKGGLTVTVGGTVDRVEQLADGSVAIIDIKTAKKPETVPGAKANMQLKAYQLAFDRQALGDAVAAATTFHSAGLLYPRVPSKDNPYTVRAQPALSPTELTEFVETVLAVAVDMHSPRFEGPEEATRYGGDPNLETSWVRIPEVSTRD